MPFLLLNTEIDVFGWLGYRTHPCLLRSLASLMHQMIYKNLFFSLMDLAQCCCCCSVLMVAFYPLVKCILFRISQDYCILLTCFMLRKLFGYIHIFTSLADQRIFRTPHPRWRRASSAGLKMMVFSQGFQILSLLMPSKGIKIISVFGYNHYSKPCSGCGQTHAASAWF